MKNLKEGEGHLWKDKPEQEVDDLNPTEDGEASEEAHCAPNETQLGLHSYLEENNIFSSWPMTYDNKSHPSHPNPFIALKTTSHN